MAPPCAQGSVPCVGPTDGRGVGEVPPPLSVGALSGGAATSELAVPVPTGTPVELVPPGRATASVGVGVSKALLHQHPHTVGTVVAAGEPPAAGNHTTLLSFSLDFLMLIWTFLKMAFIKNELKYTDILVKIIQFLSINAPT